MLKKTEDKPIADRVDPPRKARTRKPRKVAEDDDRPFVSIITTTHRGKADNGAREALEARAARFYDCLSWRVEETHKGKIDRLMGRRK